MQKTAFVNVPNYYANYVGLVAYNQRSMGKQRDLAEDEKKNIVSHLGEGRKSLEIAQELSRDHRTVK